MIRIDHLPSSDHVLFEVSDTGVGIPEDKIEKLFTEFYQVDDTFHRQQDGAGLGLALTKRLLELQGGEIQVESTVGEGSTFTFLLPRTATVAISHSGIASLTAE